MEPIVAPPHYKTTSLRNSLLDIYLYFSFLSLIFDHSILLYLDIPELLT
jgi:hypothetical protein